jgi:hypothetical protein
MSAVLEVRLDDNGTFREEVKDEVDDAADAVDNEAVERAPDEGVPGTWEGEDGSVEDSTKEACMLKDWGTRRECAEDDDTFESLCFEGGEDITPGVSDWAETREDQSAIFCLASGVAL